VVADQYATVHALSALRKKDELLMRIPQNGKQFDPPSNGYFKLFPLTATGVCESHSSPVPAR
jgi:hypothetical protein